MALDEMEKLKEATLRRLSLEPVEFAEETFKVVATIAGPREESLEEPMRESLASHLAARLNKAIEEKAEGRRPVGFLNPKVGYGDDADCEGSEGQRVSTFQAGERCYRIVLDIATA